MTGVIGKYKDEKSKEGFYVIEAVRTPIGVVLIASLLTFVRGAKWRSSPCH